MHALLEPQPDDGSALAACERWLAGRIARFRLAARCLPAADRADFVALLAWQRLLAESAESADAAGLDEAERELERCRAGQARSALGRILAHALRRRRLLPDELRAPLSALRRLRHVHVFSTRGELAACLRGIAQPQGRVWLRAAGLGGERREVLADALSNGIQLAAWLAAFDAELARGRVFVPLEELRRAGVELADVHARVASDGLRRALAGEVAHARAELAKGWPVLGDLAAWHARLAAFVLRWHAASLGAFELGGCDPFRGPPPSGWLRVLACAAASLAAPQRSPFPDGHRTP